MFHDFGADLVDRTEELGLAVRIMGPHLPVDVANRAVVVVATRRG